MPSAAQGGLHRQPRRRPGSTRSASSATRRTPSAPRRRPRPPAGRRPTRRPSSTRATAAITPWSAPRTSAWQRQRTCSRPGTPRRRPRGCTAPTATATTRRRRRPSAAGPHGSNAPYLLRFANATWSTTAPTLSSPTGLCVNCHNPATIRSTNRVHGVGDHRRGRARRATRQSPHGTVRVGLIALASDPAPYNRGAARIVAFTPGSTPSDYSMSNCTTTSGCH